MRLDEIPIHEALKAPEDPRPQRPGLTKSQERQRRKNANREAKLKAQGLNLDEKTHREARIPIETRQRFAIEDITFGMDGLATE